MWHSCDISWNPGSFEGFPAAMPFSVVVLHKYTDHLFSHQTLMILMTFFQAVALFEQKLTLLQVSKSCLFLSVFHLK